MTGGKTEERWRVGWWHVGGRSGNACGKDHKARKIRSKDSDLGRVRESIGTLLRGASRDGGDQRPDEGVKVSREGNARSAAVR